jgi:secreted PhoX family phosphatase
MDRRTMLKGSAGAAAALTLGPAFWREALAQPAVPGAGPYGPLLPANADRLALPSGFTSRVVGRSLLPVLPGASPWHVFPDGAATFPTADGGWVLVSNSEVPGGLGGAGAIRFDANGSIKGAHRVLTGTSTNCAGGATPWGTWLSCEETDTGQVWECGVMTAGQGVARPALGRFSHEAAAVDPVRGHVYLTEDDGASLFYRFTPASPGDLSAGALEAARRDGDGTVTWLPVPDPSAASTPTRDQVPGATRFARGEGMWIDSGIVYFSTTSDHRVWAYDCAAATLEVIYDAATSAALALHAPDNLTVHARSGDLYVAEDGDNLELVLITAPGDGGERVAAPFLRVQGQAGSELTGPVFDPAGDRLYVSSQRGGILGLQGPGITSEITGPFRT